MILPQSLARSFAGLRKQVLSPLVFFSVCSLGVQADLESDPLEPRVGHSNAPLFEAVPPDDSGVAFRNSSKDDGSSTSFGPLAGGGIAVGDVDRDGRPDLYLVSGPGMNRLYLNKGGFHFEDVTETAGVGGGDSWGTGTTMVDVEGDGDLDLYVCNAYGPNQFFLNEGNSVFVEAGRRLGLDLPDKSVMATFADYDLDGDLDVYVVNQGHLRPEGRPKEQTTVYKNSRWQVRPEYEEYYELAIGEGNALQVHEKGQADILLRNDNGTFVDVSEEAGLVAEPGIGNAVMWWDYNHDGHPDLYVANDFLDPDFLYRNNGNGTFTEVSRRTLSHTPWFSMGTDCADINNDGRMDLMVLDMAATTHYKAKVGMGNMGANTWFMETADPPQVMRNCLHLGTGTGRFLETAFLSGTAKTDWSWAPRFGDFDCDGFADLFISNGMVTERGSAQRLGELVKFRGYPEGFGVLAAASPNHAYRNRGDLSFENRSEEWGLDHVGASYGAAQADFDGDGDLDLVVMNLDEPPGLYRNNGAEGNRVVFRLRGRGGNTSAIGAELRVETKDSVQVRQFNPARGFCSSDEPIIHFGLGAAETIDRLTVRWPGGRTQVLENLAANHRHTIEEPKKAPAHREIRPEPLFREVTGPRRVRHWEMPFDDFKIQPLLPNRLSQNGPGLACGDIDGDGDEDLFMGGCAGYVGHLLVNDGQGRYETRAFAEAQMDARSEDLGALFFDFDADDDLDLFVVSGSIEAPPNAPSYADRIYLNDGTGAFTRAGYGLVPDHHDSGSVVTAADYDRDGDLDLFVGGRVIPGKYPETPASRLLENKDGRLQDVTSHAAPELARSGLVTGAVWSDADDDGWIDLLVTHEWGPVKFYQNNKGQLVDRTEAAGLHRYTGWWTGISAGDVDNDGDLDYVVGNFGLNTKYHATREAPELLYYGDVVGDGRKRLIEAGFEEGTCYPHRGYSCSSNAMPDLKKRIKSFHEFAIAGLEELYTPDRLANADRFEANTLETGLLINRSEEGSLRFEFRPLPPLAQVSPVFGTVMSDLDGDGHLDLYLAQNFHGPQVETRVMNSGLSALLPGNGDGTFREAWPAESGLVVPEDAMSVVRTDLNGDALPDLVVGINDGAPKIFLNESQSKGKPLTIRLDYQPGNPTAIGARLRLEFDDGSTWTREIHAGAGYLSQSGPTLHDVIPPGRTLAGATVRWPDGVQKKHIIANGDGSDLTISYAEGK